MYVLYNIFNTRFFPNSGLQGWRLSRLSQGEGSTDSDTDTDSETFCF